MKDLAMVKLVKEMFGKVFSSTPKEENAAEPESVEQVLSAETLETKEEKTNPAKKAVKKKTEPKKKKETAKKSTDSTKPATEKKKKTKSAAKVSKKEEKIKLYTKVIKKQYGEVDTELLEVIVKNLGPSIYRKDAELVSCSDSKELDTVRRNFLIKKLALEEDKKILDASIKEICEELKEVKKKYRAVVYYRLAQKFNKTSALS